MIRSFIAVFAFLFLTGMASCSPNLQQRNITVVEYTDESDDRIFEQDDSVDLIASQIKEFLIGEGFEFSHQCKSYGLQPWTGHTQDLSLRLRGNDSVLAYVSVAKCCISATFSELETEIGSSEFAASKSERKRVQEIEIALTTFLETTISAPSLNVSRLK